MLALLFTLDAILGWSSVKRGGLFLVMFAGGSKEICGVEVVG